MQWKRKGEMPAYMSTILSKKETSSGRLQRHDIPSLSNVDLGSMEGIPDTTDRRILTCHRLRHTPHLFPTGFLHQLELLENGGSVHSVETDRFRAAVDIMSDNHGVLVRPRRDMEFNLGIALDERRQVSSKKFAVTTG